MFTPPPSPLPFPQKAGDSPSEAPSPLSLSTPETESEYPFPRVTEPNPKSPLCVTKAGPSRIPLDIKKRAGRRTLLFVALLPAALIITASLRHFMHVPVLDDRPLISLEKREPQTLSVPSASGDTATPTSSSALSQSSAGPPTSTTTTIPTIPASPTLPTPFPQPFDSLSSNFSTQGCAAFFANFTQQDEFRQCRSFSFLLNASSAFLTAQRNLTLLNSLIWGTCNTPRIAEACGETMAVLLMQLNNVCSKDIANQNQAALQAQIGFQSYTAMRNAACLQNPGNNDYCYVEAAAAASPADIYFYTLPLGTPLPNNTEPSCSSCVRSVLSQYAQWVDASNGSSGAISIGSTTGNSSTSSARPTPLPALSKTYPAAARLAIDQCGGTYASVGVAQPNGARRYNIGWGIIMLGIFLGCWAL